MASRPILLTIVAILAILIGLVDLVSGLLDMAIPTIIIGLVWLILGYGLWKGIKIFWYIGVIFSAINIIWGIYDIVVGGSTELVVSIIINLIILWYLFRSKVKKHFGL